MVLKHNLKKDLKDLNERIKDLEQSKKKSNDENQLLLSFLSNEIGSNDLNDLRNLLAGQKLTEILAELENRKQVMQNFNIDLAIKREELSNVGSLSKYFKEQIKAQEKETIKERDEVIKTNQEIIRARERDLFKGKD
ncbi:15995_t:CDS:2 [Funneliformis mosseae]|uniref:15995_t:CDS:1 n=1 Tax=Funneliformis mosseae TaxID=27381 RepID=A0A9N9CIL2_FUNMO|nr:15995_t:CDS:2 [Funneliformis mosseae]